MILFSLKFGTTVLLIFITCIFYLDNRVMNLWTSELSYWKIHFETLWQISFKNIWVIEKSGSWIDRSILHLVLGQIEGATNSNNIENWSSRHTWWDNSQPEMAENTWRMVGLEIEAGEIWATTRLRGSEGSYTAPIMYPLETGITSDSGKKVHRAAGGWGI